MFNKLKLLNYIKTEKITTQHCDEDVTLYIGLKIEMKNSNSIDEVQYSDVNVHETNSFFRPNFQFVSISKRNVLFYPYITMIEMKIKTNL
jgi:hypothetical protein